MVYGGGVSELQFWVLIGVIVVGFAYSLMSIRAWIDELLHRLK